MPDEIEVQDDVIDSALPAEEQVIRLRKTNKSLLAKSAERKGRIAELETENAALKTTAETAQAKYQEAIVGVPLRALAENISPVPKMWLSEFLKFYKVEANEDDKPAILNLDGTPVMVNGEPIAFTPNALWRLLTGGENDYAATEEKKTFALITRWCGASGSGERMAGRWGSGINVSAAPNAPEKEEANVDTQFGLR